LRPNGRVKRIEPAEARGARLRLALKISATLLAAAAFLALGIIVYCQRTSHTGIYRTEYEGRVIEKSETFMETREGSLVRRRLLIEDREGVRFEVAVDEELYRRVQKGMWIKRASRGAELSWP
jgi:hypothetical protein